MRFLVDTDMGIDDAVALMMILGHPEATVEAITSVVGNIPLHQATYNVGVVLNAMSAPQIPIYEGSAKPLLQYEPFDAKAFHGEDGLGGASDAFPTRPIEDESAALALIRLARQYSGDLNLLTLGPLTNIALALRLAPDFLDHFSSIVIMAGSVNGRGNTTPASEFNIAVDPEAAQIVFDACTSLLDRTWLVSWEASLDHATPIEQWREIISPSSTQADFLRRMSVHLENFMESANVSTIAWADPLAAAVALSPSIVTEFDRRHVTVDTGSLVGRGATIVDYRSHDNQPPNLMIARTVDTQKFTDLLKLATSFGLE